MWFFFALLATLFYCVMTEMNRAAGAGGQVLNFWRAVAATGVLLLALPLMHWPVDPDFYGVAFLYAVLHVAVFGLLYDLAAKRRSRVSAMYLPLAALAAFGFWYLLEPQAWALAMAEAALLKGLAVSSIAVMVALQFLRAHDYDRVLFLRVVPVGVAFGGLDALTKLVLQGKEPVLGVVLSYSLAAFALTAVLSAGALMLDRRVYRVFVPLYLRQGVLSGGLAVLMMGCALLALIGAPNPAYPGVVMMAGPLFIGVYHGMRGIPDSLSPLAGAVMLMGLCGLAFFSTLPLTP